MARGYCYEISKDKDDIGYLTEDYLYEYLETEFDWVEETENKDRIENLEFLCEMFNDLNKNTAEIICNYEGYEVLKVKITDNIKREYFRAKYESLMAITKNLTIDEFAGINDDNKIYRIKLLIDNSYNDTTYGPNREYGLRTFDELIRDTKNGEIIYFGNCIFTH